MMRLAFSMCVFFVLFGRARAATDEGLKRARCFGRPKTGYAKHLIAIRISPSVLGRLRRQAAKRNKPYQTCIHDILERPANKSAA